MKGTTIGNVTENISPINGGVATQLALFPLVTPASGLTLTFDKSLGVFVTSDSSLGPLLSERGTTIGKRRLAIGFSYEHVTFDTLDGINLRNFQAVDFHSDIPQGVNFPTTCSVNGGIGPQNTGYCGVVRDYIITQNSIGLTLNQYTSFLSFGLSNYLDISVAVPLVGVRMSMTSNGTIVRNSLTNGTLFLDPSDPMQFSGQPECAFIASGAGGGDPTFPPPPECLNQTFTNHHQASGLGDVTLRVKGTVWKGERAGLALGLDLRFPTGDEQNFLGAGAYGVKPFAAWSYSGRVSPHVNFGYEWNGSSILAGDLSLGTKGKLPNQILYSAGVEVALVKRLTAGFDLLGQRVFDAQRASLGTVTVPGACESPAFPGVPLDPINPGNCTSPGPSIPGVSSIAVNSASYGINNALLGLRYRPFGRFVASASVQLKLDDGGLRSRAIPMASATYTFR